MGGDLGGILGAFWESLTSGLLVLTSGLLVLTSGLLVLTSGLLVLTSSLLVLTSGLLVLTSGLLVQTSGFLVRTSGLLVATSGALCARCSQGARGRASQTPAAGLYRSTELSSPSGPTSDGRSSLPGAGPPSNFARRSKVRVPMAHNKNS